ncbi:uncharacterized protein BDV17DRAFT_263560 [Aspergillus undulatus]|uniref:uncharacterized protein n=1 Tax=Aspergillus undulatus TaxID=1810928 RepID=UPI003CCD49D7
MAPFATFWSACLVLALVLPQTSAWTFLWRNETTNARVENGDSARNCTQAWHEAGKQFSWDPEGAWCIKLFSDAVCENSNGIACEPYLWRKDASQNISAFLVYPMPPSSITAFGLDSTSAIPTATPASTTTPTNTDVEQTPTTEPDSSNDSSLSGGAIAGIVIGAVGAVAILCVAFFVLGLRARKKAAAAAATEAGTSTDPSSPPSEHPSSNATLFDTGLMVAELPKPATVETQYVPDQVTHNQPPNGVRMMELPGHDPGAELSNTTQLQEMVGTHAVQELEGDTMEKPKKS